MKAKANDTLEGRLQIYVSAIQHHASSFQPDALESRYREISLAPVLADVVRHNVFAVKMDDPDGVDLMFPDEIPKLVESRIRSSGHDLAAVILSRPTPTEKDVLRDIAGSTLMAARMVAEKVAGSMTTAEERAALSSAAAQVFGEMVVAMTHAITMSQPGTGDVGTS